MESGQKAQACSRCGLAPPHGCQQCPASDARCHKCSKRGISSPCADLILQWRQWKHTRTTLSFRNADIYRKHRRQPMNGQTIREWSSSGVANLRRSDTAQLNCVQGVPRHILPSVVQIVAQLGGAKVFSKLDANCRFQQVQLSKDSAPLTVFIIPFGRFCSICSIFRNAYLTFSLAWTVMCVWWMTSWFTGRHRSTTIST